MSLALISSSSSVRLTEADVDIVAYRFLSTLFEYIRHGVSKSSHSNMNERYPGERMFISFL